MSNRIYIEGGGTSKELNSRCRENFTRLLISCGYSGRMPRLVACGGRTEAFDNFKTAYEHSIADDYIALLVDSEDTIKHIEKTWDHLYSRDGWEKPVGACDEQVLLMVTCMETWIVTDTKTLKSHYGANLQESALPPSTDMELRDRHSIQDSLFHATRNCKNKYIKGERSFKILGLLSPTALDVLPSFQRIRRILDARL